MSYWSSGEQKPEGYSPCLCNVVYKDGPAWEVLYYHPRKGWVFKDGLALSTDARMIQWVNIEQTIRQLLQ